MFAKTYGATTLGVNGVLIDVEVDVSNGFPGFDIVGLLDTAVKESKERVRTAIKNSGFKLKQQKVTINLAPANIRKDSSGLDLPIAIGLAYRLRCHPPGKNDSGPLCGRIIPGRRTARCQRYSAHDAAC